MHYYHYVVTELNKPTLGELTDIIRGELDEGGFGPTGFVRAIWSRPSLYHGYKHERGFKVRVTGPAKDIELIRANLRAEYGRLAPPKQDWSEDGK